MHIFNKSSLKIKNNLPYFEIEELTRLGWIKHAFLTRRGGISPVPYDSLNLGKNNGDRIENIEENKRLIANVFGFNPDQLILLNQIHKDDILFIDDFIDLEGALLRYDAVITVVPDIYCGILTADCIPIFLIDRKRHAISAIHAGRQGTALKITKNVLKKMKTRLASSPEDFIAVLGPSIGPCCYEVDGKVFQTEWIPFSRKSGNNWYIDLAMINISQLKEEGIAENQIYWINICTCCHSDLFFSYRREKTTGRQVSFIGITMS